MSLYVVRTSNEVFKNASGVLVAPCSETEDHLPPNAVAHHLARGPPELLVAVATV